MANLIISNLFTDGDFCNELTAEELKADIIGGGVTTGSISAGIYSEKGNDVKEEAVTAAVASSGPRPSRVRLSYSFKPLYVAAWVD